MSDINVSGIITSVMPVGDYDRRVVILTKEIGRISTFAKFARSSKSSFRGCTREFIYADFKLYKGRDSYSISDIQVKNYFEYISKDIRKTNYGLYFLEVINYFTRENLNESQSLVLLYRTLQIMENSDYSLDFIRAVFEFKMLVINGEYPLLNRYIDTKNEITKKDFYNFDIFKHGLVEGNGIKVSRHFVYTLSYIINTPPQNIYSFKLRKDVEAEFIFVINKYFKFNVDKKFKTLDSMRWLEDIEKMKQVYLKKDEINYGKNNG